MGQGSITQLGLFDEHTKKVSKRELSEDEKYQRKVEFAINLLRRIPQDCEIELSYSGGKDSDVILELARMAGIPFRAIYKNTTIDPPGTIAHCKERGGVEIINPDENFFDLIRANGLPNMFMRFCCEHLKEYKVLDRAIHGIRKAESRKRKDNYKEPEICRVYSKESKVKVYLPILEWTDRDVERFISERGIKCHPLYYDKQGKFHVERRLGCMGCPIKSKNLRRKDFKQYPKMLRQYIKNFDIWLKSHPESDMFKLCGGNPYNKMFYELFCRNAKDYDKRVSEMKGHIFSETETNTKKFLEDYFKIDLTI